MKRRDLIIVDNFLDNPDKIRELALKQEYELFGGKNWPGRDSKNSYGEKEMTQACSAVVGEQLVIKPENKCSYFRITKEGQYGTQHIHFVSESRINMGGVFFISLLYFIPQQVQSSGNIKKQDGRQLLLTKKVRSMV